MKILLILWTIVRNAYEAIVRATAVRKKVNEGTRDENVELLRLQFEQEKWKAEIEMREREQGLKEREQERSRWTNPLVVAIFAAALAALGNAVIAVVNGQLQRELEAGKHDAELKLEESKAESARILEMIKTGNTETASTNLKFLLDTGLVSEKDRADRLRQFLSNREPGTGPSLPASGSGQTWPHTSDLSLLDAIERARAPKARDLRVKQILDIAANSPVARYNWGGRGVAPIGYTKGMAAAYALVYCNWKLNDPGSLEMARAASADDANKDALSWLNEEFAAAGMRNDVDGADTLRHLFVLLTGLGMRESAGRFSEGIDPTNPDSSEAGLFSVEYQIASAIPLHSSLLSRRSQGSAVYS